MKLKEFYDENKDYKVVYSANNIAEDRLQLNKAFFGRLFSNCELNENGQKFVDLIEKAKANLLLINNEEKNNMDRIVNQVHDELQEMRYKYRELLDAADGLAISSTATNIAGTIFQKIPIVGAICLGATIGQTGAQIGCQVEGTKKQREFMQLQANVGIEIQERLRNRPGQRFQDSFLEAMRLIAETHKAVDPVQMVMQMLIIAVSFPKYSMKTHMANLKDFYVSDNASEVVKELLKIDKEVTGLEENQRELTRIAEKYSNTVSGIVKPYSGIIQGAAVLFTVLGQLFQGQFKRLQTSQLVAISAAMGPGYCNMQTAKGLMNKMTNREKLFSTASKVMVYLAIAAGVVSIGFSIASLVERGQECKEIDELIKTSRGKHLKYNDDLFAVAKGLQNPEEKDPEEKNEQ